MARQTLGLQCCLVDSSQVIKGASFFPAWGWEGWARRALPHQPLRNAVLVSRSQCVGKGLEGQGERSRDAQSAEQ